MGDLEFGFEEMQGVKLGYLIIQGKQMFALSQVFTDLLKNIPRTTVHKRMDHLNVKKHHCDLDELRQLKAINSVAFHAAKCTLISREDVEALYFSCKTERVLKSNKRRTKTKTERHIRGDTGATETAANRFWKEKLWLSLRGVPPSLALRNKAVRPELSPNLPQIYSKSIYQNFQPIPPTPCRAFRNYETVQIPGKCAEFGEKRSLFRSAEILKRKAMASAISTPSDSEGLKRKRRSDRHFGCRKRRYRQLLLVPSCCKPKTCLSNRSLKHFSPDGQVYLERYFQESCSSDSECSSGNDSDFGSSLSTSSTASSSTNSRTSDDDEEDSLSCSSEESSDAESSSHSDSSSVSSLVSVQSIRFRRAGFSSLNAKAPLVLQPTFHYKSNFQHKNGALQGISPDFDDDKEKQVPSLEIASWKNRHKKGEILGLGGKLCSAENKFFGLKKTLPKTSEFRKNKDLSPAPCSNGKVFHQQRHSVHQAQLAQYDQDKHAISKVHGRIFLEDTKFKKDAKQSPFKLIKTETEEVITDPDVTRRTSINPVKIKVEDTLDEYEYATQDAHRCNTVNLNALAEQDLCKDGIKTTPPPFQQEPVGTLTLRGEYKNGARVRKSHRASVWGKKTVENVPKTSTSPRSSGKSTIKRSTNHASSSSKPTFSFMANFPCPPSLVISSDGDLSPAYSLNSLRTNQVPHPSHPVWRWQLGASVVPPHLNHRFRKETH